MSCFSSIPVFDQLDVVSYEEVVRLPAFKRKTLVLIGRSCPGILCSTGAVCWNQGEPGLHRGWGSARPSKVWGAFLQPAAVIP